MRKDEEVKEMFDYCLEQLKQMFKQKDVTVTVKGVWITIRFGDICTVRGRGYRNALRVLDDVLEELVDDLLVD